MLSEINTETPSDSVFPSPEIIAVIEHILNPVNFLDLPDSEEKQNLGIERVNKLLSLQDLFVEKEENGAVQLHSRKGDFVSTSVNRDEKKRVMTFSPSVFELPKGSTMKNCVSIMMPFSKEFDNVYSAIKAACVSEGIPFHRADDFWKNSVIIQDIFELICRSSIVIVDFSNRNENVFYEAGIAHTLGKHVIPITQSIDSIPFDLRHHRHIVYLNNGEGLRGLEKKLIDRLASLKE
ncbi:hypothetical protein EFE40_01645 [Methanohalophilus halophilus]|uniref:Uncharacterized protein n=1 Tax=Methanohalophilus halophilus TaxID=2177 RepID=A0A3M9LCI0_9EURY|nr:hypothetical protein EFE40_01645 [Methanohalophilus halophilus]